MFRTFCTAAFSATFALTMVCPSNDCFAADAEGWQPLLGGKDLSGWQNRDGNEPGDGWVVEDGALVRKGRSGDIWTKQRFGDFSLDLEFNTAGNSGVFIRTDDPKNNVQTGIEVAINRPAGNPGKHSTGAIYDCLAPTAVADKPDQFNHMVITAKGNKITVVLNDRQVIDMDLDRWSEPRKNPDGSGNKFATALKDFKREGHIGFQDHGAVVSYRNVKIKPLGK